MTQYVTNASKKKPMRLQVHAYDIIDVNIDKEKPCPIAFAQFKCHLIENLHSFISISKYLLRCVNLQNWLWLKPLDKIHEIEIRYLRKKSNSGRLFWNAENNRNYFSRTWPIPVYSFHFGCFSCRIKVTIINISIMIL